MVVFKNQEDFYISFQDNFKVKATNPENPK